MYLFCQYNNFILHFGDVGRNGILSSAKAVYLFLGKGGGINFPLLSFKNIFFPNITVTDDVYISQVFLSYIC